MYILLVTGKADHIVKFYLYSSIVPNLL